MEVLCCVRVTGVVVGFLGLEQDLAPLEARRIFRVTGLVVGRVGRRQRL